MSGNGFSDLTIKKELIMGIRKWLGLKFEFQDEAEAEITQENEDSVFIVSTFFTGWMAKVEFWEMWGVEE